MSNILADKRELNYGSWLEFRNKGIEGPDVSIICGISKFKSVMQL